jgi:hypothetical protein
MRKLRAALLLLLGVQLMSSAARAQCTKDTECKGDRVCSDGVCSAPEEPPAADPTKYRRRTGLLVTGIVMSSVGVGTLIGALAVGVVKATCNRDFDEMRLASTADELDDCTSYDNPLLLLTAGGLVLTGAGVPLLIMGAKKVPVQAARVGVSPWLGPRSGGLTLHVAL